MNVFFAFEVKANWPLTLPEGRIIEPSGRHVTVAFLGRHHPSESQLNNMPKPPFTAPLLATAIKCLLLRNVVAWHLAWESDDKKIVEFVKEFQDYWRSQGYAIDKRKWLPHVSMARVPYDGDAWLQQFIPLQVAITALHLYESQPKLTYKPIESYEFPTF